MCEMCGFKFTEIDGDETIIFTGIHTVRMLIDALSTLPDDYEIVTYYDSDGYAIYASDKCIEIKESVVFDSTIQKNLKRAATADGPELAIIDME